MAITLEANYQKRLGLPQYSSHAYSITVRTEVTNLSKIEEASSHLYRQLQDAVDRDIQETGFLPGSENAAPATAAFQRGGASNNRPSQNPTNPEVDWCCSEKQRGLIEKLMKENNISFTEIDELANFRFQSGLKQLNKMQASGLIDEMFDTYASKSKTGRGRR